MKPPILPSWDTNPRRALVREPRDCEWHGRAPYLRRLGLAIVRAEYLRPPPPKPERPLALAAEDTAAVLGAFGVPDPEAVVQEVLGAHPQDAG